MQILVAKNAGYCFGVRRAVDIVENTLKKYNTKSVYSLGEIIHNPQVVNEFVRKGLKVVKDIDAIENKSIVIISAHGRSNKDIEHLKKKGCQIIDATCPYVKYPQNIIKKMSSEGYYIILLGDKEHPEIKGLTSFGKKSKLSIVDKDIDNLDFISEKKVALLSQTTQSKEDFKRLTLLCVEKFKEIRIFNTICDATKIRQEETVELAKRVDLMIVIGGKNSANTRRLYELSKRHCKKVLYVETAEEIDLNSLRSIKAIGITAGASTPDYLIDKVKQIVNRLV